MTLTQLSRIKQIIEDSGGIHKTVTGMRWHPSEFLPFIKMLEEQENYIAEGIAREFDLLLQIRQDERRIEELLFALDKALHYGNFPAGSGIVELLQRVSGQASAGKG